MNGILNIQQLLVELSPLLHSECYVFCSLPKGCHEILGTLDPIGTFSEHEGLSLILTEADALKADLNYEGVFRKITLEVQSSLQAVGLTAAVSSALAKEGISANIVAATYHDHIFVPRDQAEDALKILRQLSTKAGQQA
tara:strand:+ start:1019 stop:1435 length:417 start_codon:yes stop_codon:yes gene_type:complete